jgi:Protein of unknown function (DUF3089)
MRPAALTIGLQLALLGSCAAPPPAVPAVPETKRYDDPSAWLCLPGRDDACARDLSATVFHPDGTRTLERREAASDPKVDCFYVYPTVDLSLIPGNHDDFQDLASMSAVAASQAARFRETCAVYAPLYRQVTIGSYLHEDTLESRLAFAFSDVEAAFRAYLAKYNRGRPIVLIGHSQGADMVIRLLQRVFDGDPAIRARLVVAMPIGWDVEVAKGKTVGATFANIPVCTKGDETGCVITYRSYEAGSTVLPGHSKPAPGAESACVDPASIDGGGPTPFSRTYLSTSARVQRYMRTAGVDTPFVELPNFYAGQCVDGPDGFRYLAVSLVKAPGDVRDNPIAFDRLPLHKQIGLHVIDVQLAEGDLVDLVARRAAKIR